MMAEFCFKNNIHFLSFKRSFRIFPKKEIHIALKIKKMNFVRFVNRIGLVFNFIKPFRV